MNKHIIMFSEAFSIYRVDTAALALITAAHSSSVLFVTRIRQVERDSVVMMMHYSFINFNFINLRLSLKFAKVYKEWYVNIPIYS